MQSLGVLGEIGWLSEQPAPFRAEIAAVGAWRTYPAGAVLFQPGDPGDAFYGVADGAVELRMPLSETTLIPVHWTERGFWFGDSAALVEGEVVRACAVVTREATLFRAPAGPLRALLDRRPEYWRNFYRLRARNTGVALTLLAQALALSTAGRVARQLLALGGEGGDVRITHSELGALVGATRPSVNRALGDLESAGAIRCGYGRIEVLDPDILLRLSTPRE